MADVFTVENLITLVVLTALETVLGFDNLLYISIEAKRVEPNAQVLTRRVGMVLAIALRIILLFVVLQLIAGLQSPWFSFDFSVASGTFNGHSLIVLGGGIFLIRTAVRETRHLLTVEDVQNKSAKRKHRSFAMALFWILVMNIVFSFDTVLSSIALTRNFAVMALAIVISGFFMAWLSDYIARFLEKNRLYEVLGLFVLLLVGAMLMAEGGHIAQLKFFGYTVEPMAKSTFYFILVALVAVDVLQGKYQKKLNKM